MLCGEVNLGRTSWALLSLHKDFSCGVRKRTVPHKVLHVSRHSSGPPGGAIMEAPGPQDDAPHNTQTIPLIVAAVALAVAVVLAVAYWATLCSCFGSGDVSESGSEDNDYEEAPPPRAARSARRGDALLQAVEDDVYVQLPAVKPRGTPRGGSGQDRLAKLEVAAAAAAERASVARGPAYKAAQIHDAQGGGGGRLFCGCGGPGTIVQLLPCGCASLCLACAQEQPSCPACGCAIEDSVPSFRG